MVFSGRRVVLGWFVAVTLSASVWAQGGTSPTAPTGKSAGTPSAATGTGNPGTAGAGGAAKPDVRLTKEQGKELFAATDTILKFASDDSKLPIQHEVKRKLVSRADVNAELMKKFHEDKGAKKMEQSEIVLKKFGLLDRDFHLQPFLISLLTEQIAGFYDNKTKTMNLVDWIGLDEQKPVMAHELTHALQDQKVNLEKWSDIQPEATPKNVREDNVHIETDEASTARDAVLEGQAMAVFVDYTLKGTGRTLATSPDMEDKLKDAGSDTNDSPILARAPLLLQRSLLFPYDDGLAFEDHVLVKAGVPVAFAGVLERPPASSFEVMHPDAYLQHAPVPVLRLPDLHPMLDAAYAPYDSGVMGEVDVQILTELFGGQEMSSALTPAWAGGVYYAVQRKSASAEEKQTTASLALLYYSQWKNADSALSFQRVYAGELPRKYSKVVERKADEQDGEQVYSTNEGDVLISLTDKGVFVGEGFDLALSRKLRDAVTAVQGTGTLMNAGMHDPVMGMVREIAGFGVMKAGLRKAASSF